MTYSRRKFTSAELFTKLNPIFSFFRRVNVSYRVDSQPTVSLSTFYSHTSLFWMNPITLQRSWYGPVHSYSPLVSFQFILNFNNFCLIWTVCAVASRYHSNKPDLYSLAMEFARDLAGKGLVEGHRSVDVCQAYLIMAVYPVPKKKWAEDRSWLLMGVAIRWIRHWHMDLYI